MRSGGTVISKFDDFARDFFVWVLEHRPTDAPLLSPGAVADASHGPQISDFLQGHVHPVYSHSLASHIC
jgi:hypothetical protein